MNLPTKKYTQDLRRYYRLPAVQTSLTLVLSLFVMATFIIFALRPTIVSIVTLKKTIVESEATLKKLDTKVTNLQKAANQFESIKSFLPALNTSIPNTGALYAPLTLAVESLSNENSLRLDSESLGQTLLFSRVITPFKPTKGQNVVALPFTARVTGEYLNVSAFLTKLLSMERVLMIESVTITREASAKDTSEIVALNISGSAYYLADEAQLQKSLTETKGKK